MLFGKWIMEWWLGQTWSRVDINYTLEKYMCGYWIGLYDVMWFDVRHQHWSRSKMRKATKKNNGSDNLWGFWNVEVWKRIKQPNESSEWGSDNWMSLEMNMKRKCMDPPMNWWTDELMSWTTEGDRILRGRIMCQKLHNKLPRKGSKTRTRWHT